jgi:predicted transport protein
MKKVSTFIFAITVGLGAGYIAFKKKKEIVDFIKSKKVQSTLALIKKL